MNDDALPPLSIPTADGPCPTFLFTPDGPGRWPGVILYMDGPGIRPAIKAVARRMGQAGFAVLLPDLFHRAGPYAPVDPKVVFTDPALKAAHRQRLMATATNANAMADTAALLDAIPGLPQVAEGPVGIVGYCMGGRLALVAAATFPDRVAVAASFHGGGLATDKADSPHRLAADIRAQVYVAGAIEDDNFDDGQKTRLIRALEEANVDHRVETYPAHHGWVPADTPAHDPAEAEHHWAELVPLLAGALRSG